MGLSPHLQVWASAKDALDSLKRAIRFATYDWTRELPWSLRVITMIGMGIQGYAIWAALSGSLIWPILWPSGVSLYATILPIYYIGFCIQNATLSSELIRKTQLESGQLDCRTRSQATARRIACTRRSIAIWPARCPTSRRWWTRASTKTTSRCCW